MNIFYREHLPHNLVKISGELMDRIKLYGDWIFYGGLLGVFISGFWLYCLGKRIGAHNLRGKHFFTVISTCLFPTILLPLWLCPASLLFKMSVTILLVAVGIARYFATTKAQEASWSAKRHDKGK